ncbi:MAG: hypothetical protein ACRDGH_11730 [Candidatus Limnocylindria bacterium]
MQPVSVQIITYAPTAFRHCQHCELAFEGMGVGQPVQREAAASSLPDDLAREYQEVSDWVHRLLERHPGRLAISVIDAASIEGVWQSLRHRVRRYPAMIVAGREKTIGTDFGDVDRIIDRYVSSPGGRGGA